VLPFQCSASVSNLPLLPSWSPTSQTSEGDSAEPAKNMSRIEPGWGDVEDAPLGAVPVLGQRPVLERAVQALPDRKAASRVRLVGQAEKEPINLR
jgi:hypothetical protein